MLDVLYGEFVQMFWVAANPRDSIKRQNRRPQPDWWDDECYDKMFPGMLLGVVGVVNAPTHQ